MAEFKNKTLVKDPVDYWPNCKITHTHISCALRLIQPVSNWHHNMSTEEFFFRLAFISKHKDKFNRLNPTYLDKDKVFYSPILPKEYFYLDNVHVNVMSSQNKELDEIQKAIKKLKLGDTYRTPDFQNLHYGQTDHYVGLMAWKWNGTVPKVKDLSFPCPYNDNGDLVNAD